MCTESYATADDDDVDYVDVVALLALVLPGLTLVVGIIGWGWLGVNSHTYLHINVFVIVSRAKLNIIDSHLY